MDARASSPSHQSGSLQPGARTQTSSPQASASDEPLLTVGVIARDEQGVLEATLDSARTIADELLVLDTGSTDGTVEIARGGGARVVEMPWQDDFSAARNCVLEEAAGRWLLWLDAGERIDGESAEAIREFVREQADPDKVYMLLVELAPTNRQSSSEQIAQPRLMPLITGLKFHGRIRETLQPAILGLGMSVELAPGRILCHPRRHDPKWQEARCRRNLRIVAAENGRSKAPEPRLLLAMGEAFENLGDTKVARAAYAEAVRASEQGSTERLEAYYGLITSYSGDPECTDELVGSCVSALEAFPLDAQLLCALGNCLQERGHLELATRAFEAAVRHGQIDLETWHLREVADIAAVCLSLTLQLQKQDDQAREILEEVLEDRDSTRVRRSLIDLHVRHGRSGEALEELKKLPQSAVELAALEDAVRGACHALREDWVAALGHLQSAYVAGCRDPLCLRWLAVTLLSNGQIDAAEPVLRDWKAVEPGNAELMTYLEGVERARGPSGSKRDPGKQVRIDPAGCAPGSGSPTLLPGTPVPLDPSLDPTGMD